MIDRHYNNAVGPQIRSAPTSQRWIAVVWVSVTVLVGLAAATQYFAASFDYQPELGAHFHHLYPPWSIVVWSWKWHSYYPTAVVRTGSLALFILGVGFASLILYQMVRRNTGRPHHYLHGSARWANKTDLLAAGLLGGDGVYVGAWTDRDKTVHYLRHNGPEHVLTYAPTRSGKGIALVIPTLLSWPSSAVITDLKGELWALTAGWRHDHAHNKTLRFEPANPHNSIGFNPLDEIRVGTEYEVGDVQNLAMLIVDPDGRGLRDHWQKTSQALLVGCILHVLYKSQHDGTAATLPAVDLLLADPERPIEQLWMEMMHFHHHDGGSTHPVVARAGRDMMDRPSEEAGSILSAAKSHLSLYRDPVVARNVARSGFRITDLMNHRDPVSLYIITQPNDKVRLRPLVRVMVNMILRRLTDSVGTRADGATDADATRLVPTYKHRLLMMLDEFPSLGKLEIMQESLAFMAGYGIKCYLICQDINQLRDRDTGYGHDEAITSACNIQNAFPPNRIETAEHLSRLTGATTVVKERITTSGKRISALLGHVSRTIDEVQRPLLTSDEAMRMPVAKKDARGHVTEAGDMIIYCTGYPAIYGRQPLYFQDPVFRARAAIPPPAQTDLLRQQASAASDPVVL